MIIKKIKIKNFRNIKNAELDFSLGVNVFYGNNAEGKTNMLEAISLCLGKSFRKSKTSAFFPFDLEKDNENYTDIRLIYSDDNNSRENEIKYQILNNKPVIKINDIELKDASLLYGDFKYVVFIPEHLNLIKGVPEQRRDYIDNIALLQNKTHRKVMENYKKALIQRNSVNYQIFTNGTFNSDFLSIWNDILAKQGVNITFGRLRYFEMMRKFAIKHYSVISNDKEKLEVKYKSSVFDGDIDLGDSEKLYNHYLRRLSDEDSIDRNDYKTKIGAHRDDIVFTINDKNAREYASQGQLRSIALVLKLSEADIINELNKEKTIILLDEVLSELDKNRREFVFKHFDNSQVFITTCNKNDINFQNKNIKIWNVKNGEFFIDNEKGE